MASDVDRDEKHSAPGMAMRLTVAGICQKFSSVKNISTSQLSTWMKQKQTKSENQTATDDVKQDRVESLIILV